MSKACYYKNCTRLLQTVYMVVTNMVVVHVHESLDTENIFFRTFSIFTEGLLLLQVC